MYFNVFHLPHKKVRWNCPLKFLITVAWNPPWKTSFGSLVFHKMMSTIHIWYVYLCNKVVNDWKIHFAWLFVYGWQDVHTNWGLHKEGFIAYLLPLKMYAL